MKRKPRSPWPLIAGVVVIVWCAMSIIYPTLAYRASVDVTAADMIAAFDADGLVARDPYHLGPDSGPESTHQMCDAWAFSIEPEQYREAHLFRCDRRSFLVRNLERYQGASYFGATPHILTYDRDTIGLVLPPSCSDECASEYDSSIQSLLARVSSEDL